MKTIKQFNISLIIRGLIIPVILATTIIGGIRLNEKIVSLIDFGFTSKLATLSSTAGAFVRLDDHEILIQPRSMSSIRNGFDESWLTLTSDGFIHTLHLDGSVSLEPTFKFLDNTKPIYAFTVLNENLFSIDVNGQLLKWSREGNIVNQIRVNAAENSSLAASLTDQTLLFGPDSAQNLIIIDQNLQVTGSIPAPDESIADINFNTAGQLVMLTQDQQLLTFDADSKEWSKPIAITCAEPGSCAQIKSIAFSEENSIWAISEALTLLSADGVIDPDYYAHPNYHDHTSESYLSYVVPMREVRTKQELTYLYSFILNNDDKTIAYVLDSSTDDDFTHIGYVDSELELDDFISGMDVLITTKPYVSEIKPWGQWGLVKIGFAPIYGSDGRGAAIMGSDQNVSSIDQVSREALVILALSSFVFLLFGATASWFIAKSLTSPLLELKDNVLSIAAGFLDRLVAEPKLKDLHPLSEVFKEAGNNLKKEVVQGPQILQKFENLRLDQDFRAYVELKVRDESQMPFDLDVNFAYRSRLGWITTKEKVFIWILNQDEKPSSIHLNTHNTMFQTVNGLIQNNSKVESIPIFIQEVFKDKLDCIVEFKASEGMFSVIHNELFYIESDSKLVIKNQNNLFKSTELNVFSKDSSMVLSISERSSS